MRTRRWATILTAGLALSGCGNIITTDVRGIVGLTADASGTPIAVVVACGAAFDQVSVVELLDRSSVSAEQTNPFLAEFTAPKPPGERFEVSLTDPGPPWIVAGRVDPHAGRSVVVNAASTTRDEVATPVEVSPAAYAALDARRVLVRQGEWWTRAEFDERACSPDRWPTATASDG
ncbi:MAG: hypothetical protein U0Q21_09450 [Dermatophilaceae bacterium]